MKDKIQYSEAFKLKVMEESGWSGDFYVHVDAGFASYDYIKELF